MTVTKRLITEFIPPVPHVFV